MAANWTVRDYVDFEPGFRRGMAIRQQNAVEAENARRQKQFEELAKERAVYAAAMDKEKEDQKRDAMGLQFGKFHGMQGTVLPPEVMGNPAVLQGYFEGAQAAKLDATRETVRREAFEAQAARSEDANRSRLDAAKIRAGIPLESAGSAPPMESVDAPFIKALEDLDRFQAGGMKADVDPDKQGFPTVTRSYLWHDASDPGSYMARRQEIQEQWDAARKSAASHRGIPSPTSEPKTNRLPVLKFP